MIAKNEKNNVCINVDNDFVSRTNAQAFGGSHFGIGSGTIVYDDLGCTGSEPALFKCPNAELGHHKCAHTEDVGVSCGKSKNDKL